MQVLPRRDDKNLQIPILEGIFTPIIKLDIYV